MAVPTLILKHAAQGTNDPTDQYSIHEWLFRYSLPAAPRPPLPVQHCATAGLSRARPLNLPEFQHGAPACGGAEEEGGVRET